MIEVNPRASRTVPFLSKVTGVPMVELAVRIALGATLPELGWDGGLRPEPAFVAVKAPAFSTAKLRGVDPSVGPGMQSTGEYAEGIYNPETGLVKFRNVCWFTNLDHGRRHQPLPLMTMADNLKYSKHKEIKGKKSYDRYDNYDAIEVPFTDSIPSDYDGVMGVPISFLDKYSPEQFEIVGMCENEDLII